MGKEAWGGCSVKRSEVRPTGWLGVSVKEFLGQVGTSSAIGTEERGVVESEGSARG